tara:strand:+ start:4197 stop:6602 length:2406 start_codon:yes stop_codon:yes gene_type:complete
MSFFGGFAKGFVGGFNEDVAAQRAADLERTKYMEKAKWEAAYGKKVDDSANTLNFGALRTSDGVEIDFGVVKNYTETNKELAAEDNIIRTDQLFRTPFSEIAAAQGKFSVDNRDFMTVLNSSSQGNAAEYKSLYAPILHGAQTFLQTNSEFIETENNKLTKDVQLYYKYPWKKHNNWVFDMISNDLSNYNLDRLNNQTINVDDIIKDYPKTINKKPVDKTILKRIVSTAIRNRNPVGANNLDGGRASIANVNTTALVNMGLMKEGDKYSSSEKIMMSSYMIGQVGRNFNELADNKGFLNDVLTRIYNNSDPNSAYYLNPRTRLYDIQTALAYHLPRNSIVTKPGNYIAVKDFNKMVTDDGFIPKDVRGAWTKSMGSVHRAEAILRRVKSFTEGSKGKEYVPLGIWQTAALYGRGLVEAPGQIVGMFKSVIDIRPNFLSTNEEGTSWLMDDFGRSTAGLEAANKTISDLRAANKEMDDLEFYQNLKVVSEGVEITGFDITQQQANDANSAIIQYHSYLLAFEMAAAIQGGGDSRTISDRDVNIMQKAIASRLLTAGSDFVGVVTEIRDNMKSVADYWGLFTNAMDSEDEGKYRAAKLMTGPGGAFNMDLTPGAKTENMENMALKIAGGNKTIDDLDHSETRDGNVNSIPIGLQTNRQTNIVTNPNANLNEDATTVTEKDNIVDTDEDQSGVNTGTNQGDIDNDKIDMRGLFIDKNVPYYKKYDTWGEYSKTQETAHIALLNADESKMRMGAKSNQINMHVQNIYDDYTKYFTGLGLNDFLLLFDNDDLKQRLTQLDSSKKDN